MSILFDLEFLDCLRVMSPEISLKSMAFLWLCLPHPPVRLGSTVDIGCDDGPMADVDEPDEGDTS
jgi:hypothetical protein